jgi:hypothetical protein
MTPCWMEVKSLTTESTMVKHAAIEVLRCPTLNGATCFPRGSGAPAGTIASSVASLDGAYFANATFCERFKVVYAR